MEAPLQKKTASERKRHRRHRISGRRELHEKSGEEILELINSTGSKKVPDKKYRARYLEVLTAAAKLFSIKGYHSATTTDIAEDLGIHQTSLYYYIKSKEQALEQICDIAIQGYVRFSQRIKNSRAPVADRLRELIFLHLITLEQRPRFFKVFQDNRKDLNDVARHKIGRQIRKYEENVEAIITQGVRAGEFKKDLNIAHTKLLLVGICNSVSIWWGIRSTVPLSTIADEIADLFIGGISA